MRTEQQMRQYLIEELQGGDTASDQEILQVIDRIVLEEGNEQKMSLKQKEALRQELFCSVRKLDILQELVDDPDVTEIMVNGYQNIFVEKGGEIERWDRHFISEDRLQDVVQQIAGQCNRMVNEQQPVADARLENGARVNIVLPPVSLNGPTVTIRRFPDEPVTMEDLLRWKSLTEEAAEFLKNLVRSGYSILIGGGTSTGKTTFLNALSHYIPKKERIITIEDNAELQIQGVENLVRLEARETSMDGNHTVTIRDLIRTALRMRPDRIIIGEVRGAEAGDWLISLNTGHSGSLGTAHANTVRDMIGRLEMMVLMGMELPIPVIRHQIASGIEILVQLTRDGRGRRMVEEIAEIDGIEEDEIIIHTLFCRNERGELIRTDTLHHKEKLEKYEEWQKEKPSGKRT